MKAVRTLPLAALGVVVIVGLARADDYKTVPGGTRYQYIGEYTVERLNKILTSEAAEYSSNQITYPPATNAVGLYRVVYPTVVPEKSNKPVEASGLIAIPKISTKKLPMVSYQHGTVFSRTEVPSNPEESTETRLMVALFAGQGYIVIGPDYIGKGMSTEPDSYMVKDSTAQACVDMLAAAKAVCADLKLEPGDLFLSGFSQGSWSTMVFRYKLESQGIPVKAAATAATPSDIYLMNTRWINKPSELDATWLPGSALLLVNSYEQYYGLAGLSQAAIKPKYWQTARDLYDNKIGWTEAAKVLPTSIKELLQPEFAAGSSLLANRYYQQLQDNQAYRWRYQTPSRYYYGKMDECMPPYVATLPVEYQNIIGGAPAEAVYAGDKANHRGTFMFGMRDQKKWFDSLLGAK